MSGRMFDVDGPLTQAFDFIKDLIVLNLLTVLCCLPIVTAGASIAAMNTIALKIVRGEEGYIAKPFFKAFRENLKIGIKSTLIIILIVAVGAADVYAMSLLDVWFADVARVLLYVFAVIFAMTLTFLFPIMAKFEANVKNTWQNAFKFSLSHFPMTLGMFVINAIPWVIIALVNALAPIMLFFGLSLPAYFDAKIYNETFKKIEMSAESTDKKESTAETGK